MYHSTTKIGRGEWNRCPHTLFSLKELRVTHNVRTVQPNILGAAFEVFGLRRQDRRARWTVRAPDWTKFEVTVNTSKATRPSSRMRCFVANRCLEVWKRAAEPVNGP